MSNKKKNLVHGFKVFNLDWTCIVSTLSNLEGTDDTSYFTDIVKQYSCPGKFEEDVVPIVGAAGMHFCKNVIDCFHCYEFDPKNRVAEVIAYGTVDENNNICCTDKLEIVREIPWIELLQMTNTGMACTGMCNSGKANSGNNNSGDHNTGIGNKGSYNTGGQNIGNFNVGTENLGNYNVGSANIGKRNTGYKNIGDYNTGSGNLGNENTGNYNIGNNNSGDFNISSFNNGCFMTDEVTIPMFNKPSNWTYINWINSRAFEILRNMPLKKSVEWVYPDKMSEKEKLEHPEWETTNGYLKQIENKSAQSWWDNLTKDNKKIIFDLPNFDPDIFKKCTDIDVRKDMKRNI